jgi:hypothetical protein
MMPAWRAGEGVLSALAASAAATAASGCSSCSYSSPRPGAAHPAAAAGLALLPLAAAATRGSTPGQRRVLEQPRSATARRRHLQRVLRLVHGSPGAKANPRLDAFWLRLSALSLCVAVVGSCSSSSPLRQTASLSRCAAGPRDRDQTSPRTCGAVALEHGAERVAADPRRPWQLRPRRSGVPQTSRISSSVFRRQCGDCRRGTCGPRGERLEEGAACAHRQEPWKTNVGRGRDREQESAGGRDPRSGVERLATGRRRGRRCRGSRHGHEGDAGPSTMRRMSAGAQRML